MAHVTCDKCGDFGARKRDDGRRYCGLCWDREQLARWNAVPTDVRTKRQRQGRSAWVYKYGIDEDEYKRMLDAQAGRCAICGSTDPIRRVFSIDHDLETGRVRGLLCNRCNTAIGMLADDPEIMDSAASYLRSHGRPDGKRTIRDETSWAPNDERAAMHHRRCHPLPTVIASD